MCSQCADALTFNTVLHDAMFWIVLGYTEYSRLPPQFTMTVIRMSANSTAKVRILALCFCQGQVGKLSSNRSLFSEIGRDISLDFCARCIVRGCMNQKTVHCMSHVTVFQCFRIESCRCCHGVDECGSSGSMIYGFCMFLLLHVM